MKEKEERWSKNQMVVRQPECIIEALVVVILIFRLKRIKASLKQLADLHLFGETQTAALPNPHPARWCS